MGQPDRLNILTEKFPYGKGEQFYLNEIIALAGYFDEVVLYPLNAEGEIRKLPENIKVNLALSNQPSSGLKKELFKNFGVILYVFLFEFIKSPKRFYLLKKIKQFLPQLLACLKRRNAFMNTIKHDAKNYYYSLWMNDGALLLSLLRLKKQIPAFSFRVNGFDLFSERREGEYMPFRYINFKYTTHVFVLSKVALSYLKKINYQVSKLSLKYHSVKNHGVNKLVNQEEVRIVSCANVIQLKRIDKIISALHYLKQPVKWTHFGDGDLMDDIKRKANELPANINVDIRGSVDHAEIINTYKNESVNLFIHTSESEGFGMAIAEAQSFGIPAVVIGVGGVLDIVDAETGVVLPPQGQGKQISEAILTVLESEMNTNAYRSVIKEKCLQKFDPEINYTAIAKDIKKETNI